MRAVWLLTIGGVRESLARMPRSSEGSRETRRTDLTRRREYALRRPDETMDTQTRSPADETAVGTERTARRPVLDLSVTQIIGGSLAAATGAALTSSLGVAGTIVGAATISVITVVAGAFYTHYLRETRERVRVRTVVASRRPPQRQPPTSPAVPPTPPVPPARPVAPLSFRLRPRSLAVGVATVFGLAIAGITGYELATGEPISGGSGGTTINQVTGTGPAAAASDPTDPGPAGSPSDPAAATADPTSAPTTAPTPAPTPASEPGASTTPPAESPAPSPTPSSSPPSEPPQPSEPSEPSPSVPPSTPTVPTPSP